MQTIKGPFALPFKAEFEQKTQQQRSNVPKGASGRVVERGIDQRRALPVAGIQNGLLLRRNHAGIDGIPEIVLLHAFKATLAIGGAERRRGATGLAGGLAGGEEIGLPHGDLRLQHGGGRIDQAEQQRLMQQNVKTRKLPNVLVTIDFCISPSTNYQPLLMGSLILHGTTLKD